MLELKLTLGSASTAVLIENGLLGRAGSQIAPALGGETPPTVVISDAAVAPLYGNTLTGSLRSAGLAAHELNVEPGEASKSLETAGRIYQFLADHHVGRDAVMIALGGGVVSDLAGFVAATWMRGVRWAVCPTTLEAQVDAAIGGKTAINIPGAKNLVGAFHPPMLVLIDPDCLATLPERDYCAGLAESVKHAAVFSPEFFEWHEANAEAILRRDRTVVAELLERNVRIKADAVSRDPFERTGERMLLNFGHTIGHAIEECCGFRLRHGECVALGMLAACEISRTSCGLAESDVERLRDLLTALQLPTKVSEPVHEAPLPGGRGSDYPSLPHGRGSDAHGRGSDVLPIPVEAVMNAIQSDKKARSGRTRFVLLEGLGQPVIREDISPAAIRDAIGTLQRTGASSTTEGTARPWPQPMGP